MTERPPNLVGALVGSASKGTGLLRGLGYPVSTDVPASRPAEFITVTALGGEERNVSQSDPRAAVYAWAASSERARALAHEAWQALKDAEGTEVAPGLWLTECRMSLPADYFDTASRTPRWRFLFFPIVN